MEVKGQKGKQPQQEPAEEDTRLDTVQGEDIVHLKQAPLQVFTCGAAIAVASTLVCLSMALLCREWYNTHPVPCLLLLSSSSPPPPSSSLFLLLLLLLLLHLPPL